MGAAAILLLLAVVAFVLAAFGVNFDDVQIVPIGLALFSASFLVGAIPAFGSKD